MLKEILKHKMLEVDTAKALRPSFGDLSKSNKSFKAAIKSKDKVSLIAEIKKASPSKGVIDSKFDYLSIAKEYQEAGAACISVLTDEKFFMGSLEVMQEVASAVSLPILRKDFIVDPYQIKEARAHGADAVLLIAKVIQDLAAYQQVAAELGMDVLVEVHNEDELKRALHLKESNLIIGINNRNLDNLKIDMQTVPRLLQFIPNSLTIVAESGYTSFEDLSPLKGQIDAVLIGTSIMQSADKVSKIKQLNTNIIA